MKHRDRDFRKSQHSGVENLHRLEQGTDVQRLLQKMNQEREQQQEVEQPVRLANNQQAEDEIQMDVWKLPISQTHPAPPVKVSLKLWMVHYQTNFYANQLSIQLLCG